MTHKSCGHAVGYKCCCNYHEPIEPHTYDLCDEIRQKKTRWDKTTMNGHVSNPPSFKTIRPDRTKFRRYEEEWEE